MDNKIGLVLEGGAMRGMFTCGVIDVFMEQGISFDGAIGVSAGAVFGCNIKSKQIGRAIRYNKRFCTDFRFGSFLSFLLNGDVYEKEFCYNTIPNKLDPFDVEVYQNNPMEFYVVATDVESGKAVYQKCMNGDAYDIEWMRASASMPIISNMVEIDGHKYLDGGMSDSIPLEYFEKIGYKKNVVVLTQPEEFKKKLAGYYPLSKIVMRKYPRLIESIKMRHIRYNATTRLIKQKKKSGEVFVIQPKEPLNIGASETNPAELERVYQLGREAAEDALDALKQFLS